MRSSSYWLKLVLLSVMIGTFPVLTLGWYSYHYSSQSVLEQVEERNSQVLRQSQLRVEQTLKMIDFSTSQLLGLPIVSQAIALKLDPNQYDIIKDLYKNLSSIQTYELGIKDVYLLSLEQDWLMSNAGLDQYNQPGMEEMLRSYAGSPQGSIWISGNSASIQGADGLVELKHAVINIKKWPVNSPTPRGLIAVVLSSQQLGQLINADDGMGSTFILDSENRVIAHADASLLGNDVSSLGFIQAIRENGDANGVFTASEDAGKTSISFRKSPYNGWTYVSVVPTKAITQQAMKIGWTSILVSMGVLAATLLVALIGSRRMYDPVKRIYRSLLDEKESENAAPKDEFRVITNQIQSIMSDRSKLKFELEGQQKHLVEFLVRKMLLGEVKQQEALERLSYYGYGFSGQWGTARVLLFQIDHLGEERFSGKDRDLLLFAIGNIASEIVPEEDRLLPIVIQESVVLLMGSCTLSEEAFKTMVFERAAAVQAAVKRYLQLKTSVGISRSFRELGHADRAYEEGGNALKYRARLGEEVVLFIEDVQPDKGRELVYPKELAEELSEAVKSLDAERARKALSAVMESLSRQDYDYDHYQLSLVRLLMDLIRQLQDAGIPYHSLPTGDGSLFETFLKLRTNREIESWFGDTIIEPALCLLEERRQTQFTTISQEVKRLIEEAFDTDLTLEKCSARINYHPQYISRVFRQETGVNFADYLSQYRLEVAKKWLRETNLTVTEIAERLKYNNPANFIRYFRKIEGITPGQYRDTANVYDPRAN
ncbi:AraC family transcriptional regulator [Paenibacillus soyae]|uniref:AraC family transcriptional regulator n=1 Tax=Paenibacillus soyae TaxID=2969249 RepID=A0A9X2SCZ3_9BACL|nr:AraC family transcriptional regulator [Paenibacillus soyae]MCR2807293.1 AraC family transcriptional regulator [Paenibacillus soyae]